MKPQILSTQILAYKKRTAIIKAMAHPARLFMLEQLQNEELCVCELAKMVEADISTVSKHLTLLKHAGLVKDRKVGLQVFYSLRCPCVLEFVDCLEAVFAEDKKDIKKVRGKKG